MGLEEALTIVEKIDLGMRDDSTRDPRFAVLWHNSFLRETFMALLHSYEKGTYADVDRCNFEVICALLAPGFTSILTAIDLPVLDAAVELPI